MWTKTTAVLIVCTIASCSADGIIKLSGQKLVGKTTGDKCTTNGAVTKCQVNRGEEVTFTGKIEIKGNNHLTISSLSCTITFTREKAVVSKVVTCAKDKNTLAIKGNCQRSSIPNGQYNLDPFTFKAPSPKHPAAKVMQLKCDVVWSDRSKTSNKLLGSTSVTLK